MNNGDLVIFLAYKFKINFENSEFDSAVNEI